MLIGHPPGAAGCFAEGVSPYRDGTSGVAANLCIKSVRGLALVNPWPATGSTKPQAITRQPAHRNTCSRIRDLPDCSHVCRRVHNFTQFSFLETREEHPFHVCARRQSPEEARKWWRSRFYQGGCPVRGGIV